MILFSTGHEQFPFDYLMGLVGDVREAFPGEEIVVQYGHSRLVPKGEGIKAVSLLSPGEFREAVEGARVIVSHCGEGNLLMLQEVGRPFVLVPRTRARREHVDDHQVELARVLVKAGLPVAYGREDLIDQVRDPKFVRFHFREEKIAEELAKKELRAERVLLVTSSGGHFRLMQSLVAYWEQYPVRRWVTFKNKTTVMELEGEDVVWAHSPTNRNLPNLARNLELARRTLKRFRPEIVVSTGAGVAVPFLLIGKLMKCRTVFVESITRVEELSLSARMLWKAGAIDVLVVQHHELGAKYPAAIVVE